MVCEMMFQHTLFHHKTHRFVLIKHIFMNGIFHAIQSLAYLTAAVFGRVRLGTPSSNHLPIRVLNNNIEHLPVGTLILIFLS